MKQRKRRIVKRRQFYLVQNEKEGLVKVEESFKVLPWFNEIHYSTLTNVNGKVYRKAVVVLEMFLNIRIWEDIMIC